MKVKVKGKIGGISSIVKSNGVLIPAISAQLMKKEIGTDRGHGWNSPSGVGNCPRKNYFTRLGYKTDLPYNEPRLQRIFDNGTYTHIRLQEYMLDNGILLQDEAPLFNVEHKIMGTTDGLLLVNGGLAVLEIKSINSNGFRALTDAKAEHKLQAEVYLFCLNAMQEEIMRGNRGRLEDDYYCKLVSFLKDGSRYTKQEKVDRQFSLFQRTLDLLEKYPKKITQVYFLYENKDTQELKEFAVDKSADVINEALSKFDDVNICVENTTVPPYEKCLQCNGCNYKKACGELNG